MFSIKELFTSSANLLFPNNCELCHTPLLRQEESLCLSCYNTLPFTDKASNALMELKVSGRFPFSHVSAFLYFYKDSTLQELMHKIKYRYNKNLTFYLGKLWGIKLQKQNLLHNIDAIIPVPLHKSKEHKRGYNQSGLLAASISEVSGVSTLTNILVRVKNTDSQTKKTRQERLENMEGVFKTLTIDSVKNKHILLIDDVFTTGATIESCAIELLKTEGVRVSIATLAIAMD